MIMANLMVLETKINGDIVYLDLNEVWRDEFARWDCLVDTDTASAIATVIETILLRKANS